MMLPESLAASAASILGTMLNGLCWGVILTAIVWGVLRLVRRSNATTRYWVWWGTLAGVVCLLLLAPVTPSDSFSRGGSDGTSASISEPPRAPAATASRVEPQRTAKAVAAPRREREASSKHEAVGTCDEGSAVAVAQSGGFSTLAIAQRPISPHPAVLSASNTNASREPIFTWIPLGVGAGWIPLVILVGLFAAAAVRLARVVHGCCHLQRVKRAAAPLSPAFEERLRRLLSEYGVRRRVWLRCSAEVRVPTVLGLLHPTIIFPTELVAHLSASEFKHVLMHELAHIRRWDDWTNLIQKVIEAVLFFHPAVWWIGRQLCLEREIASDDCVISHTGRVRPYAVSLAKLVAMVRWPKRAFATPGVLWTKSQFARRIEVLLNKKRNAAPRLSKPGLALAMSVMALAVIRLGQVPPVVAVSEPELTEEVSERGTLFALDIAEPRRAGAFLPAKHVQVTPATVEQLHRSGETRLSLEPARVVDRGCEDKKQPVPACKYEAEPAHAEKSCRNECKKRTISYGELVKLFDLGVTGDYVRAVRRVVGSDFSIDDLVRLRANGVEQCDLEKLHRAVGLQCLTIDEILKAKWRGLDMDYLSDLTDPEDMALSLNDQLQLHRHGVTSDYLAAVADYGFDNLSVDDIILLYNHGVSEDYLDDLASAEATDLTPQEVIELTDYGVAVDFIEAAVDYGFDDLTIDDVTKLRSHGVSEGFLEDLGDAGVDDLTPEEVTELLSYGVDADYVSSARAIWDGAITIEEIIKLRDYGVPEDYLRELDEYIGDSFTSSDAIDLHTHGVPTDFIAAVDDFGFEGFFGDFFDDFQVNDVVDLQNSGVSEDYLSELQDTELDLTPEDVIKLRVNGVTVDFILELEDAGYEDLNVDRIVKFWIRGLPHTATDGCNSGSSSK